MYVHALTCVRASVCEREREREREREGKIFSIFLSLPPLLELIVFSPLSEPGKKQGQIM